jgi:hypothetical protein
MSLFSLKSPMKSAVGRRLKIRPQIRPMNYMVCFFFIFTGRRRLVNRKLGDKTASVQNHKPFNTLDLGPLTADLRLSKVGKL